MSIRILSSVNLVNAATDPVSATAGDMYFNTVDLVVKIYDGTTWNSVGSGGGSSTTDTYAMMGVY
jgi:hypothetical protein